VGVFVGMLVLYWYYIGTLSVCVAIVLCLYWHFISICVCVGIGICVCIGVCTGVRIVMWCYSCGHLY